MKAATVAVLPTEHPMDDHDDFEPHHESSPTDHVLNELQLHGYRPFADEPDQRLLPDGRCTVRLNLPVLIFMHADLIERSVGFGSKVNTRVRSRTRRREERLFG